MDCSNPAMDKNIKAVYETLRELEVTDKTIITVFNKIDKLDEVPVLKDENADYVVQAAIKKGEGLNLID